MTFSTAEIREDGFLGGRLVIAQPLNGYRAGADAVMLAAACPARPGEAVLELGCGAGAALLCLGARVPDLQLTGLELQPDYADLARRNAERNAIPAEVVVGDLSSMPPSLIARSFDRVMMNPPYFQAGTVADAGRGLARHEDVPLGRWIAAGLRRLRPGGSLTLIQRADRLGAVLAALTPAAGNIRILPVAARAGRPAGRTIVAADKGARGPLTLLAPFIMHAATHHEADAEDLSNAAQGVLRHGDPISI